MEGIVRGTTQAPPPVDFRRRPKPKGPKKPKPGGK